jgi:regulator of sigma E protease
MLTTILAFIFVLGLLVFVHELGHFITAKMVGIRVERFSLGFPPRMFGKKIGDTDYCISWIPLGGYVKMSGMVDESLEAGSIKGEPWEYMSKPVWQRIIVITAGSIMNFITAVVIFALLFIFVGIGEGIDGTIVGETLPGRPAETIGLQPGDVITAVNGQPVATWEDLTNIIHRHPDVEIAIQWQRGSETLSANVTPQRQPETDIGLIGIGPRIKYRQLEFWESWKTGFTHSVTIVKLTVQALQLIVTGEEPVKDAIGGPLRIAEEAGKSAKLGFQYLLAFTAVISLNLGFFNMLPFPVLDGGHLVLLLIEGIRRKPLSTKTVLVVQKIGMAFLLALIVFIFFNDLRRVL